MSAKTNNNNQEWTIQRHRQHWTKTQKKTRHKTKKIRTVSDLTE